MSYYGSNETITQVDSGVIQQVNYEADLLNRILALGIGTPEEAKKVGESLFPVIKSLHDQAEQNRLLEAMERLKEQHGILFSSREQADYLLAKLRENNWKPLESTEIANTLRSMERLQTAGLMSEIDAYDIIGNDVRPALRAIWANPNNPKQKKAAELAKRLDLVREFRKLKVFNEATGTPNTPKLEADLAAAEQKSRELATELGLEQDTNYTIHKFEVSERELKQVVHDPSITQGTPEGNKAEQADFILSTPEQGLDKIISDLMKKEDTRTLILGGTAILALLLLLTKRRRR